MNQSKRELSPYGWRPADPGAPASRCSSTRGRGDGKAARAGLAERAREKGIEAVILAPGQDLDALAREAVAAGADALGMAGGDGSLTMVAAVAAAHDIPFVCVPAGTRNHFALDVGVTKQGSRMLRWAVTEAIQRQPAGTRPRQVKDGIIARRGKEARNIAKVAAARELLTLVFYGMRDGHVRRALQRGQAA